MRVIKYKGIFELRKYRSRETKKRKEVRTYAGHKGRMMIWKMRTYLHSVPDFL